MGKWASLRNVQRAISFIAKKRLDTMEEIEANTEPGMLAGAAAVAELNNNLAGFTPVLDDTGKITGYKTQAGADTVFPFSGCNIIRGIVFDAKSEYHFEIDGKNKMFLLSPNSYSIIKAYYLVFGEIIAGDTVAIYGKFRSNASATGNGGSPGTSGGNSFGTDLTFSAYNNVLTISTVDPYSTEHMLITF